MTTPVIDFHIHTIYYDYSTPGLMEFFEKNCRDAAGDLPAYIEKYKDPATFAAHLNDSGADYGVILAEYCPINTGIATNENVYNFCLGQKSLIPFACLNPYMLSNPAAELERLVKDMGFRGLKLYPSYDLFYPNDPIMYPVYSKAQELGIPVMMHTGSSTFYGTRIKYCDPIFFDDLAVDFPNLNLLMCHSGRGFWYDRAFFLSRLHKNLYMEISGLPPQKLFDYFPEFERNADKIIFGTDWPALNIKANIAGIRALPLKEENIAKILGGNAARLLKID